jgi:hypothetical protein
MLRASWVRVLPGFLPVILRRAHENLPVLPEFSDSSRKRRELRPSQVLHPLVNRTKRFRR